MIKEFSGWAFEPSAKEKECARAREFLGRFKAEALNGLLDLLELPRGSGESGLKVCPHPTDTLHLPRPAPTPPAHLWPDEARRRAAAERGAFAFVLRSVRRLDRGTGTSERRDDQ